MLGLVRDAAGTLRMPSKERRFMLQRLRDSEARFPRTSKACYSLAIALIVLGCGSGSTNASDSTFDAGTYFGGSRGEGGYRIPIGIDADGNLFVVGCTDSADLPTSENAVQPSYSARGDLFVAKLSPSAERVIACTYLGGLGEDGEWAGASLALKDDGSVIVAAVTSSPGLPTSPDAWSDARIGDKDIYIAHLSPDLSTLLAATYLGGTRAESHVSIVLDSKGLLVIGSTTSSRFPTKSATTTPRGRQAGDVFVCRLDENLTSIEAGLILQGRGDDVVESACLASDGSLFLAGWTSSDDLPMHDGGALSSFLGGAYDGFVLRIASDLSGPVAGAYLGGSDSDFLYAMDLSNEGLWVAGHSASADLPVSSNAIQTAYSGGDAGQGDDGFVIRLSVDLAGIAACTYYGGAGWENIVSLRVIDGSVAWIGGTTSPNLPLDAHPLDSTFAGFGTSYVVEGFVCIATDSLTSVRMASYLGGSGIDTPGGLALDAVGRLWIAGATTSEDLSLNGFAPSYAGGAWRREGGLWGGDLFLVRLSRDGEVSGG